MKKVKTLNPDLLEVLIVIFLLFILVMMLVSGLKMVGEQAKAETNSQFPIKVRQM